VLIRNQQRFRHWRIATKYRIDRVRCALSRAAEDRSVGASIRGSTLLARQPSSRHRRQKRNHNAGHDQKSQSGQSRVSFCCRKDRDRDSSKNSDGRKSAEAA
jgi:hypothetical protein